MQLMRLGGCTRVASYQPCPKHGALQSSTELHWGTFGSGLMDTSLTGISTVLSQHEAPGDSPWEALASYTSVAMLFFKNLHTDMAHLVSDYKDGIFLSDVSFVEAFFAVAHSFLRLDIGNQVDYIHQDMLLPQHESQLNYD